MKKVALFFAMISLLSACSQDDSNTQGTVFDDTIRAMDTADSVEQQLNDAAEKQRQQIEKQGG